MVGLGWVRAFVWFRFGGDSAGAESKAKEGPAFPVPVSARPDGASEHGFGLTALSTALKAGGGRLLRKVLLTAVWVASLV